MQIERIKFKEFEGEVAGMLVTKAPKPFLPGGRFRGEVPPPPPAPTFTEEELKNAERESYKKGFLEGTEDGRKQKESEQADIEKKLMEAAENFANYMKPLLEDYRAMAMELKTDVPKVALAVARKVAGAALTTDAQKTVEDIATRCVETMIQEPRLVITVHDSLGEALEQKLAMLAIKLQAAADIVVMRDATMSPADCKIEWKDGAFVRNTIQLWQEIERAIEGMTAGARHDTNTHLDALAAQLPDTTPPSQKE